MRMKSFDKCIKNEMEDDIRKEQNKIREEIMELQQDVTECMTDIADIKQNIADNKQNISDNKQEIHNINTRHIPSNIQSKLINCYIFFHRFVLMVKHHLNKNVSAFQYNSAWHIKERRSPKMCIQQSIENFKLNAIST